MNDSGAYSERTYKDRWHDDNGPTVKASIEYDASQPDRALAALDKVFANLREDIENAARAYRAEASR